MTNRSPFDGIDRSVAPTSLCSLGGPARPLDDGLIREAMARIFEVESRMAPALLPSGLFEIVRDHGWGKEALAWCNARYAEQFEVPK